MGTVTAPTSGDVVRINVDALRAASGWGPRESGQGSSDLKKEEAESHQQRRGHEINREGLGQVGCRDSAHHLQGHVSCAQGVTPQSQPQGCSGPGMWNLQIGCFLGLPAVGLEVHVS